MDDHVNANGEIPRLRQLADLRFELRKFLSFSEVASERHGIQAQQYQLLQVIGSAPPGQAASISYLADRMVLRHNSTVELVDRAERAGLVRRHTDERDLRRSLIKLTPHGEQLLRTLVPEHLAELDKISDHLIQALNALNTSRANSGQNAPASTSGQNAPDGHAGTQGANQAGTQAANQ